MWLLVTGDRPGCGKTTLALNLALGLMHAGLDVGMIDLDTRHSSLTRYLDRRRRWLRLTGRAVPMPRHHAFFPSFEPSARANDEERFAAMATAFAQSDMVIMDAGEQLGDLPACVFRRAANVLHLFPPCPSIRTGADHAGSGKFMPIANRMMVGTRATRAGAPALDGLSERSIHRDLHAYGLTAMDDGALAQCSSAMQRSASAARCEILRLVAHFVPPAARAQRHISETGIGQPAAPWPRQSEQHV